MTTPKTLTIGTREWNVLLAHNAAELATFFQQQPAPTAESYKGIIAHIDRMKGILPGWLASAPPVAPEAATQQGRADAVPASQSNGAAPRKRGGWPKGKKRTRTAAAQAMQ
jgi:hypothetical protein